jgi:hypothetical protein
MHFLKNTAQIQAYVMSGYTANPVSARSIGEDPMATDYSPTDEAACIQTL